MAYREEKQLSLPAIDQEITQYWNNHSIFQKSIDQRDPNNAFVFYEGPPSANGKPGIHHVMARTIKDIFCRFQTMQGKRVERKGGWDTHGLPIELSVEKELGITKEDIGTKISIDDYNSKCRETVMRYKNEWDELTRKMGYWVDLDHPYITFNNEYIEAVWGILKIIYDKQLLYKGYTIQPYSPAAGTGLSSHELNQPGAYREVKDVSAVAIFHVEQQNGFELLKKIFETETTIGIMAWTTTPWTLPSNTALAVGEHITYAVVDTYNPYTLLPLRVILAKDLISKWFKPEHEVALGQPLGNIEDKKIPYQIQSIEFTGKQLEGLRYQQLLPYAQPDGDAFKVLVGDFVSTADGTGIVHIAPSFGADDMRVAKKYGIGTLTLVDKRGKFTEEVSDFPNEYVKEDYLSAEEKESEKKRLGLEKYLSVDERIVIKLKKENKLFNSQKYAHNYPHCWRTDKPILYYPLDSWFIKVSSMRDELVRLNNTINWKPESTGSGRFGNWLENVLDWNLSRSRYWGIPLPIWRTEDTTEEICIDNLDTLEQEINKANVAFNLKQTVPTDIHRPYIDEIILCSPSGKQMRRELDLIDVWFDSGSMPIAQWGRNTEMITGRYPADFIAEGVDQTRGWFYTLHAIATMVRGHVAFKNVVSTGLILDKNGEKMSKSKGNVVDPFATIANYGADATRWYMITNAQPWDNLKFDIDGIEEARRKFFGTLYNTYSFFALYANIDKFTYREAEVPIEKRSELDRWILSCLNTLIQEVQSDLNDYEPTNAARKIEEFLDGNLSNWYVRLSRRVFWKGEYTEEKIAAYQTLYTCLNTIAKLMSPYAPYMADWLYLSLNNNTNKEQHESVHLALFPKVITSYIDTDLERRMEYARNIASMVLSLRKGEKIRVRQPLRKILIPVLDDAFKQDIAQVSDLIKAEVNIKDIEYLTEDSGVLKKKAKANFRVLGKKLGKDMQIGSKLIGEWTMQEISSLDQTGSIQMTIGENQYTLDKEDIEIVSEDIPGWLVTNEGALTVALDITLDDDLIAEGTARELVNKIQNIRKTSNFNVTDRIDIQLEDNPAIHAAIANNKQYIMQEVLANRLELVSGLISEDKMEVFEDLILSYNIKTV